MKWTDSELDALRVAYAGGPNVPVDLIKLSASLGRDRHNVCRKARQLGLTNAARRKAEGPPVPLNKCETVAERRAISSARMKVTRASMPHPRGMLGKKHKPEIGAASSARMRAMWVDPNSKLNDPEHREALAARMYKRHINGPRENPYSRAKRGKRPDLDDLFVRSAWEANYARYLNWRMSRGELRSWEYECKTFEFEGIKRGARFYTPDFKLTFPDDRVEWHEVKGWMDPKSITRLKRMKKYHPTEVVRVIGKDWFSMAKRTGLAGVIRGWE